MGNFDVTAALSALPATAPARQVQFLGGMATVSPDDGGWRQFGTDLFMRAAGLSRPTFRQAVTS